MQRFLSSRWLLLGLALANVAALWSAEVLPFSDLPQHTATLASLRDTLLGRDTPYLLALSKTQYVLYYVIGAALSLVVSPEVATKLILSGVALGLPFSLRTLAQRSGGDERAALFAVPLFWCQSLLIGFINYLVALPVLFLALAWAFEQAELPTRARAVGLACLGVALYLLHLSALLFFLPAAAGILILHPKPALRIQALLPLIPAVLLCLFWLLASRVTQGSGQLRAHFATVRTSIRALSGSLTDIWRGEPDNLLLIALGLALLLGFGFVKGVDPRRRICAGLVGFAVLLYFAMPHAIGWLFVLNQRYAVVAALLAPLLLRGTGRRQDAAFALAALVGLLSAILAMERIRSYQAEVASAQRLLEQVPPRARLLAVVPQEDSVSRIAQSYPLHHVAALARARRGAVVEPSFLTLAQSPLLYRPEQLPPAKPQDWEWEAKDTPNAQDARYFDFLFSAKSQWAQVEAKGWQVVATEDPWRLYAKPR